MYLSFLVYYWDLLFGVYVSLFGKKRILVPKIKGGVFFEHKTTNKNKSTNKMVVKGKKALLVWCSSLLSRYNITVTNFTNSWWDGLAFCGLLHRFFPESIPMLDLVGENWRMNLSIAFRVAEEVFLLFFFFFFFFFCGSLQ